jgi:hypothetical protein
VRAEACSDGSLFETRIPPRTSRQSPIEWRTATSRGPRPHRVPQRSSHGASRLRCTILSSRARRNRLRRRSGGRTSTLSALGGGLASLLAGLFSFLLFFHPLLLDLIVRRSLLQFDAVAPCALKSFEWSSHLYPGISIARLHSLPATLLNRAGAACLRRNPLAPFRRCHVIPPRRNGARLRDLGCGGRRVGGAWVADIRCGRRGVGRAMQKPTSSPT